MNFSQIPITDSYTQWDIEETFDAEDNFIKRHTQSFVLPIWATAIYLAIVFGGQAYMKDKPRFELRGYLCAWSAFLAIFSIIGTVRTSLVAYHFYTYDGIYGLACHVGSYTSPISKFWAVTFVVSKFMEFVDTFFIVLRKQKLIFLHWYHHITVMGYVWICYSGFYAGGLIFMTMNFIVHAVMYSYYAIRAYGIRLPRVVNVVITSLQILQMILGFVSIIYIEKWSRHGNCRSSQLHIGYGFVMYLSYFVLFAQFFYDTYIKKRESTQKKNENCQLKKSPQQQKKEDKTSVINHESGDQFGTRLRKQPLINSS